MSLAVVVAVVVAGAVAEPVAVMPWKNLGGAEHAWLSLGMQETLTSDLRRARTQVVERGRLAEAMRDRGVDDVVGAASVGRLVGAKTLVLGSFQVQGQGLRLTARFVDVASGEVLKATTETGTLDEVFRLQDAVVRALSPAPSSKPSSKPSSSSRPKLKPPQVIAYQRFSESLASSTPEAARALLEEALRLDADFVYAKDALVALGAKVDVAVDAVTAAVLARADQRVAVAVDAAAAVDARVAAARDALASLERGRCFHRLLAVSERFLAIPALTSTPSSTLGEDASAARVLALARLRRQQLALQAGEKHLIAFAGGPRTDDVAGILRKIAEEQRSEPARRGEYVAEVAEAQGDDATDVFRRCIAAKWSLLPAEMEQNCRAFLARHERDVAVADNVRSARAYVAWARALVGDFAAARRLAAALEAADPGALDDSGLREVIDAAWARD